MIPILFENNATSYTTNGLGRLSDCISCIVTEERNGMFECEFKYPVSGNHFDDIQIGRIITCTHDEQGDIQPFDIYAKSEPINGVVTFRAHHISYRLNEITVKPFTAGSCAEAVSKIGSNSVVTNPFTFWTDKTTTGTYNSEVPRKARAMLGGEDNSILDVYGTGEYEFDKFDVKLFLHRGEDTDVFIRYGKNLVNFFNDEDTNDTYTAVVPFWLGSETTGTDTEAVLVTLPEWIISSGHASPSGREVIVPMDLSSEFTSKPTVASLRTTAQSKLNSSNAWQPNQRLTIDFVQLWQTEEYKDYAPLQRLRLCDTCTVIVPMYGISIRAKVIRTEYNVLLDRYDKMDLGDKPVTYAEVIGKENKTYTDRQVRQTSDAYKRAIAEATEQITGGTGGYVILTLNANRQPIEILITDNLDIDQAVNIWRWNQGGLGHSHSGYDGPYDDVALTQDGKINASMILTGVLTANLITAGTITDTGGNNYWNLDSGEFVTKYGQIANFNIRSTGLEYEQGAVKASVSRSGVSYSKSNSGTSMDADAIRIYSGSGGVLTQAAYLYASGSIVLLSSSTGAEILIGSGGSPANVTLRSSTSPYTVFHSDVRCESALQVYGSKSRIVKTNNYDSRLLYAYETPTPLFGDIGETVIAEDGLAYVDLDDIFTETIAARMEYQVFLQKEGEGDCWIADKDPRYFIIRGTPGLKVAWELKAKQFEYETTRLELSDSGLDEYRIVKEEDANLEEFINEQEELLYG